jgi:phosphoribosyl-ATP pyrophosphohydrolase/phosphoribosyl-AMP cyclohydrolase
MDIKKLKFDDSGLIPCIVQDAVSNMVLMMAYMNQESLEITLVEKRLCFWSRSRQQLWRKGESSGNSQQLISLRADCDGDTLLAKVVKAGPACHTGEISCFFQEIVAADKEQMSLEILYQLLEQRKREMPEGSYTSYLFDKGREKILKKVGEESTEVVIAAMKDSRTETIYEIADLCYHLLVLMVEAGISIEDIRLELAKRHVIDKKIKQESGK